MKRALVPPCITSSVVPTGAARRRRVVSSPAQLAQAARKSNCWFPSLVRYRSTATGSGVEKRAAASSCPQIAGNSAAAPIDVSAHAKLANSQLEHMVRHRSLNAT
jgi:hypothetical protein